MPLLTEEILLVLVKAKNRLSELTSKVPPPWPPLIKLKNIQNTVIAVSIKYSFTFI